MKNTLISMFGPNYRTSIAGYAGAIFAAILPIIKTGTFNLKTDWPSLVQAAGIALFGIIAKDAKVTGLPGDANNQPDAPKNS